MPCNEVFKTSVIVCCPRCGTDRLQIAFNPDTLDVGLLCVPCYGDVEVLEHMKLRELPCNYRSRPAPPTTH